MISCPPSTPQRRTFQDGDYTLYLDLLQDINQNGKFDLGELETFADHGITWFNLEVGVTEVSSPDAPAETQPGVFTFNTGSFVKDGVNHRFADVALEQRAFAEQVYSDAANTIVSDGCGAKRPPWTRRERAERAAWRQPSISEKLFVARDMNVSHDLRIISAGGMAA